MMTMPRNRFAVLGATVAIVTAQIAPGTLLAQGPAGSLEKIRVHGPALEGNLSGDDSTREAFVYLPPSYATETERRYPVVYFLHGYTATADAYSNFLELPRSADQAIADGAREMIIVLPDAFTAYSGSMYSNSATTGDWESFVADDLVAHIDANYRTLPARESRGLAGHSMGGYGTMRIGMKRPDAFGVLYAMSSCCLLMDPAEGGDAVMRAASERADAGEPRGRPDPNAGFANALFAQAAAWAPNPDNPPDYFDLPFKDGELDRLVAAKWIANAPLVMVDQYVPSLKRYRAIALDVGDADPLGADNLNLDAALTRLGVDHRFELYEGDHGNRVRERFAAKLVPFFSEHLDFEPAVTPQAEAPLPGLVESPCPPADAPRGDFRELLVRDWPNLCRYKAANAALAEAPRVVFMGDSITEGWVRGDPGLFVDGVIGRGISAQTSPQMLVRFRQDVLALEPRVVHIMAGTNDIAGNTGPATVRDYQNNILAMVDLARANGIAVVLAGIPPSRQLYHGLPDKTWILRAFQHRISNSPQTPSSAHRER
jgi:enterochelin esterase-like enzyme